MQDRVLRKPSSEVVGSFPSLLQDKDRAAPVSALRRDREYFDAPAKDQSFSDDKKSNKPDDLPDFLFCDMPDPFFCFFVLVDLSSFVGIVGLGSCITSACPKASSAFCFDVSTCLLALLLELRTGGRPLYFILYPQDPQVTTMAFRHVPSVTRRKASSSFASDKESCFHIRPPPTEDCRLDRYSAA